MPGLLFVVIPATNCSFSGKNLIELHFFYICDRSLTLSVLIQNFSGNRPELLFLNEVYWISFDEALTCSGTVDICVGDFHIRHKTSCTRLLKKY